MYLSQYFLPTLKNDPKDAVMVSHKLMLKAGMIRQLGAGLYNWLPMGLKVLNKVSDIVRGSMNNAGALEVLMPTVQPIELWEQSGRYGQEGGLASEMLVFNDRNDHKLTFSPTAEEAVVALFAGNAQSYKDLPKNLYQIQWKFRDEIRPRFGLMRAREFLMKDAYSFDVDEKAAIVSYEAMFLAYLRAFKAMGLNVVPVQADSGDMGGDKSHEFHILADTGESTVYYEAGLEEYLAQDDVTLSGFAKFYANEADKHKDANCTVGEGRLICRRGIEAGHIFYLGDKYTKAMNVTLQDASGHVFHPKMGCYGIGISRIAAAIIEVYHDERGIMWPESVSPFDVGIVNVSTHDERCVGIAQEIYDVLRASGKDVLLDDTEGSAGSKMSRMELIGLPWIITVGSRLAATDKVEVKQRKTMEVHELSVEAVKGMFK